MSQITRNQDIYNFVGRTLNGRFRLDSFIDEGGMGLVYRATDLFFERPVAVKILHPRFSRDPERMAPYIRAFEIEGKVLTKLKHKNIVSVYEMETHDGLTYIAMELLAGENLEDRIRTKGPLSPEEAAYFLSQIGAALDYAHERKIVHLDIKAANIFLVPSDQEYDHVKVIDFGLARIIQSTLGSTLSRVVGTPQYIAPEVYKNQASSLCDVYSLGVLTFQMLTGVMPFSNTQIFSLIHDHLTASPPSVRTYCPRLTVYNDELISLTMAKEPTERPESAGLFARHFEKGLSEAGRLIKLEKKPVIRTTVVYLDNPFVGRSKRSKLSAWISFVVLALPFISVSMWYFGLDNGLLDFWKLIGIYCCSALFAGYKLIFRRQYWAEMSMLFKLPLVLLVIAPAALLSPIALSAFLVYFAVVVLSPRFYRNYRSQSVVEDQPTVEL